MRRGKECIIFRRRYCVMGVAGRREDTKEMATFIFICL